MSAPKSWLTVKEAAFFVGRDPSRIYAWIDQEKVITQTDEKGVTLVGHLSLMRAEAATRRGRPRRDTPTEILQR